ncbi:MAG: hypothetical protein ACLU5J_03450 [Christensenellales bacterium]
MVLVTDAMRAKHMPDGVSELADKLLSLKMGKQDLRMVHLREAF